MGKIPGDFIHSEEYHNGFLIRAEDDLAEGYVASEKAGYDPMHVAPAQAKFLKLLAQTAGAKRILEVGTLGGYASMWMARAIPSDGRFVGLESDEKAAEICRKNLTRGGFKAPQFEIFGGPRIDALKALSEIFDFAFVRAETTGNVQLLVEVKRLVRKGGIIIIDTVGVNGWPRKVDEVADEPEVATKVDDVRKLLVHVQKDSELDAVTVHTAGEKGYDGFMYCIRK